MTTFVTIKTADNSNYVADAVFIAQHAQFSHETHSDTFLKIPADNNRSVVFSGTGFEFNAFGVPTDGTVTAIALKAGPTTTTLISGLNISVTDAAAALQHAAQDGNIDALASLFGNMRLTGNTGSDVLFSGPGNDVFLGGAGHDQMGGGTGNDTVDYSAAATKITASLASGKGFFGMAAGDAYLNHSIENLIGGDHADHLTGDGAANELTGNGGGDVLNGGLGADTLLGGAGGDRLWGGRGHDALTGGFGNDQFVYNALNEGGDTINGFNAGDTIMVKASVFGDDAAAHFVSSNNPVAPDAHGTFLFDQDAHTLSWDSNGSGAGHVTLLFTFAQNSFIQANDIITF